MYHSIKPGKEWLDTNGKPIQAHGAGMFYENGTFYWYGENKEYTTGKDKIWTWGIRCYSSRDLYNWNDEGCIIEATPDHPDSPFHPGRHMDRPHIIRNPNTGKLVCWLKYSDTFDFTICTADSILGPWKMEKTAYKPYGKPIGDFDLEADEETGTAYLYMEVEQKEIYACRLTADCLDVEENYTIQYQGLQPPLSREGTTHFLRNGKHYMVTSGMLCYIANPSQWAISDDWMGPYTDMGNAHPTDETKTSFHSQISYIFRHPGRKDLYIAMADRWMPDYRLTAKSYDAVLRGLKNRTDKSIRLTLKDRITFAKVMLKMLMKPVNTSLATYVWLPITFNGDAMRIDWKDEWKIEDYE